MGRGNRNFNEPMGRQMSVMGMTIFSDSADRPVVNSVELDSPADKAGIRAGDTITSVGRQTTDTMTQFMNMTLPLVRAIDPGEKVSFQIARNGRMTKVAVRRPKDSELQPLTPAEQHVVDRQGGVISPATQEVARPRQNTRGRRPRAEQMGAMSARDGMGSTSPMPHQQQPQIQNATGGGVSTVNGTETSNANGALGTGAMGIGTQGGGTLGNGAMGTGTQGGGTLGNGAMGTGTQGGGTLGNGAMGTGTQGGGTAT